MTRVLKVGIVGANWGVLGHLPGWRALPNIEVNAICTAHRESAESAANVYGISRPFWDYHKMMEDPDIDIVSIGLRPALRYDIVMAALAKGKHVFNSLPFATNLDQAAQILKLQREQGVVGVCDGYFTWLPQLIRMKELIEDGYLGELFAASCNIHMGLYNRPSAAFTYKWLADPASGGSALRNLGSHVLHAFTYLFGDIVEVVAQGATCFKEWEFDDGKVIKPKMIDTASALMRFRSGGMGQMNVSFR